jgi:hypothetical protein
MNILDFLDGAGQHAAGGQGGINPTCCVRNHSGHWDTAAMVGSGFCRPCFAYLTGDTDEDPLEGQSAPKVPPLPPWPPDGADLSAWQEYMNTASRSYT